MVGLIRVRASRQLFNTRSLFLTDSSSEAFVEQFDIQDKIKIIVHPIEKCQSSCRWQHTSRSRSIVPAHRFSFSGCILLKELDPFPNEGFQFLGALFMCPCAGWRLLASALQRVQVQVIESMLLGREGLPAAVPAHLNCCLIEICSKQQHIEMKFAQVPPPETTPFTLGRTTSWPS